MSLTARALVSFPLLLTAAGAQSYVTFGGEGADTLFRQSRNALGGEAAVMNVSSLVMKGTARVSAGDDGPPERTIEMRMLLPDQYVRLERGGTWSKRSGFSANALLTVIRRGDAVDTPPSTLAPNLLRAEKARFARLLLGIGSLATPEVWLTLRLAAPGSRVLEATSVKDNFAARVVYDAAGVPLRVEYQAGSRRVSTVFSDRRKVGDLLLPHTITTTLDGMPLEEITFREIAINRPLTKADFGG